MTTFDITLDADDDLIVDDYIDRKHDSISTVAHHSMINMISNDYADSASYAEAMEECEENPGDVWSHAEMMRYYGLA